MNRIQTEDSIVELCGELCEDYDQLQRLASEIKLAQSRGDGGNGQLKKFGEKLEKIVQSQAKVTSIHQYHKSSGWEPSPEVTQARDKLTDKIQTLQKVVEEIRGNAVLSRDRLAPQIGEEARAVEMMDAYGAEY